MPAATARETSGVMTANIVSYIRNKGGDDAVARVLDRSGVGYSAAQLEDEKAWFTYEDKIALWEAAADVLDDAHVSKHMGASVLDTSIAVTLRVLLRRFGSPRLVLTNVARVIPKFSTVARMETIERGRRHVTVTYQLDGSKTPHRLDCESNLGFLSSVGPLFGLPHCEVEHEQCQVRGADRCVYVVRWRRHNAVSTVRRRRRHLSEQVASLAAQVESLQSIAADLVSSEDTDEVLTRIIEHAAESVSAQRYLLAVQTSDGAPVRVHHDGFEPQHARRVADALLAGGVVEDAESIVIDVASARRHYGRLAAFYDEHRFFDFERQLLSSYARSAAAALDAATALEEARERGETASALLGLARRLAVLTGPKDVAAGLAEAMCPVLGATAACVHLADEAQQGLVMYGAHGLTDEQYEFLSSFALPYDSDDPVFVEWLASPEPKFATLASAQSAVARVALEHLKLDGLATVAVQRHGEVLGLASVYYDDASAVTDVDGVLVRLSAIADQAATAIENGRLLERVQHQATHDDLTGLPNRVLFEDAAARALAHSRRSGEPVALLFVDLDGFKEVNDDAGHDAGDIVLAETGRRLAESLRVGDIVARLGGDEFTVLLPATGADAAVDIARRVRATLAEPFELPSGACTISACVGVAVAPDDAAEYHDLLRAADAAMYCAKRDGRNRWSRYQHEAA
jgi:diguanylate cyclase (GGDEF)-like protein